MADAPDVPAPNSDSPPPIGHQPMAGYKAMVGITVLILAGYLAVTAFILFDGHSGDLRAGLVQNWNALAGLAAGFWLGASVGGRVKP